MIFSRIGLGICIAFLIVCFNFVTAIDIVAPTTITNPGYYRLTNDVVNYTGNSCILIQASDVTLDGNGHTIAGIPDDDGDISRAIMGVWGRSINITIKNLKVTNFSMGIYADVSNPIVIENCQFSNNDDSIFLNHPVKATIVGNLITNSDQGVFIWDGHPNGIYFVKNNVIENNKYGIRGGNLLAPFNIENNQLSDNVKAISIYSTSGLITSNIIKNNEKGLELHEGSNNLIYNNLFDDSPVSGIWSRWNISKTYGKNILGGNYLGGNAYYQSNGNGFSQICSDDNNDGICDTSVPITQGSDNSINYDFLPLTTKPLLANFSVSITSGVAPLTVQFQDTSQGNPIEWRWDVNGDGFQDYSLKNFEHTYTTPGHYTVTLSITNHEESKTISRPNYINIQSKQPSNLVIDLHTGWNFISTPGDLNEGHRTSNEIFSGVNTSGHSIFRFDGQTQSWNQVSLNDEIRPLQGIWIYSATPNQISLSFNNEQSISPGALLHQGWNAIGFTHMDSVPARDALFSIKNSWVQLIGFNGMSQYYETSIVNTGSGIHSDMNHIYPGKGYWLYMNAEGTLI